MKSLATPSRTAMLIPLSLIAFAASAGGAPAKLPETIVTATRTAQTQDDALASVTVITREDIEILQPVSLMDLLTTTPGIMASNNGGRGKAGGVYIRGTSGSQVLVLVDGIRMGSVSFGAVSLPYIPVEQIERIEIVRGPFSSLYGSDAVGGVIQIFLRHEAGEFRPYASVAAGSYNTRKASAGASGSSGKGWFSVGATHEDTDGINACRVGAAAAFAGCFMDAPDKDGFRDTSLNLSGGYKLNDVWSVDGVAFRSQGFSEFDVMGSDGDAFSIQTVGGQVHFQPNDRVKLSLRGGSNTDFTTSRLDGVAKGHFNSRRTVGSLQGDFGLGYGLATLGYDWERQTLGSALDYAVDHRVIRGLFAQWQASFGAHSVQANVRRDDNSQFGGKSTGSVLWGVDVADSVRITANWGTAFRAPTFNDLYFPGYGTPTLRPETSRNLQLGVRGTPSWGTWSVEAFRNDVRDLIEFNAATFSPGNVGRARIRGIEAAIGGTWHDWRLNANATVLDPRVETPGDANRGNQLPRRARRLANFEADRVFGDFNAGASVQLVGHRFDDIGNRNPLGGYGLLALRGGWKIDADWSLDLAVMNVLDKSYETAWYFNQPGRNYMLTLNWRPAR